MERTDARPTSTDSPPAAESLVLSAHTLGILARHIADHLGDDPTGQAFAAALDDVALLADSWVMAQLDARDTAPQPVYRPPVAPDVAPLAAPATPVPATPATQAQPPTATAAVLAATTQLNPGATARDISQHLATQHQLDVTPGSVRAILSRHRREQGATLPQPQAQQPEPQAQHGTGMYL